MFGNYSFWDLFKAIMCLLTGVGLVILIIFCSTPKSTYIDEVPIFSLESSQSIDGRFYLGTGFVDSDPVYYVYIQNEDGSLILETINAEKVSLNLDVPVNGKAYLEYEVTITKADIEMRDLVSIHVPSDSIIQQYEFQFGN